MKLKNSQPLNLQYDFFNNNALILADKVENANALTLNLAKNLSCERHTIIVDSTSIIDFDEAKKIKASINFKLPLNYSTIDFIFDKCLQGASLEFQAVSIEILNEIKKFARAQENGFIPFNAFARVLLEQYKATPHPELKYLVQSIKKYQMDEIFARSKKDKENLFKTIKNNNLTIIDLSNINIFWQKAYLDYIVSELEDEVYLIARINEENCDVDFFNEVYCKKRNIKFVPNVSYSYKKLPSLAQYCRNYILMPSLYQRADFLNANFALCNLISDGCVIFGENTDNFLYLANKYELELQIQEEKKKYRKIALSLVDSVSNSNDENSSTSKEETTFHSQRLINELTDYEHEKDDSLLERYQKKAVQKDDLQAAQEALENTQNENDFEENTKQNNDGEETKADEFQNLTDSKEALSDNQKDDFHELNDTERAQDIEEDTQEYPKDDSQIHEQEEEGEEFSLNELIENTEIQSDSEEQEALNEIGITKEDIKNAQLVEDTELVQDDAPEAQNKSEQIELSDNELDFFEMTEDEPKQKPAVKAEALEIIAMDDIGNDGVDLAEIANNSINTSFEQIVEKKSENHQTQENSIKFDDDSIINLDDIGSSLPDTNNNLPIFKEEIKQEEGTSFAVGNVIRHKKYGRGTVVKTVKYEERQLLQIEFEESGKKLLDPKVADITLEQ